MDYSDKNGIKVVVSEDKQVAKLLMFLNGEYKTWVEFNKTQLNDLISELEEARDTIKLKLEMPLEQFAEAIAKENARLLEALEYIADGGKADNIEDAYEDIINKARQTVWKKR